MIPGEYELYLFGHRRPELYGALVEERSPRRRPERRRRMAATSELVPEALLEQDGAQGLEEPVGPRRRDRPAELDHAGDEPRDPRAPRRRAPLRPQRRVLHRHAVVGRGRRPAVRDLDDAHAAGLDQRQPLGRRLDRARAVLVLRRLDPPLHALRHARRHAQPPRPPRHVLERLDGRQGPRQPHLEQGRPRQVPADHRARRPARRRRHARRRLPAGRLRRHAEGPAGRAPRSRASSLREEGRRARPDRPHDGLARLRRLPRQRRPGSPRRRRSGSARRRARCASPATRSGSR